MSFPGFTAMRVTDYCRAILAATVTLMLSSSWPAHAQERPTVLPACAPGTAMLVSAFVPQTAPGSLKNLIDEWFGTAAVLPPEKAAAAYRIATRNALTALKQSGISVTERDILIYRFTSLSAWRADINPPILAGGGSFTPLPAIDKELDLIVSMLPAACRV